MLGGGGCEAGETLELALFSGEMAEADADADADADGAQLALNDMVDSSAECLDDVGDYSLAIAVETVPKWVCFGAT